jgi:soluble lytic murein transglycosylase-like protein
MKTTLKIILTLSLLLNFGVVKAVEGPIKKFLTKEDELIHLIVSSAKNNGVDPYKALAIVKVESGSRSCVPAVSSKWCLNPEAQLYEPKFKTYSVGLFQMFMPTARAMGFEGTLKQLKNPETNTELGLAHMQECIENFGDNLNKIACCHKAGPAVKESVCKNNPDVKQYIRDVNSAYVAWKKVDVYSKYNVEKEKQ